MICPMIMRSLFSVDLLAQVQSFRYQHGGDERKEGKGKEGGHKDDEMESCVDRVEDKCMGFECGQY